MLFREITRFQCSTETVLRMSDYAMLLRVAEKHPEILRELAAV